MIAYVRTVKTSSGAIAVQIVWSTRRGSRQIEHLGSAHDDGEVEALKAAARGNAWPKAKGPLDLGTEGETGARTVNRSSSSPPSPATCGRALCAAYHVVGFDAAAGR